MTQLTNRERMLRIVRGHTGRMWIAISENVPARAWKTSFKQITRAIDDFGTP